MNPESAASFLLFANLLADLTGLDAPGKSASFCPHCRHQTGPMARFCEECGRPLAVAANPAPPAPAPSPPPPPEVPEHPEGPGFRIEPEGSLKFRCPGGSELDILARIHRPSRTGSEPVMQVRLDGELLLQPLLNKQNYFRCRNGMGFLYQDPEAAWRLFYSPDFSENLAAENFDEVVSGRGQNYRYVWKLPGSSSQQVEVQISHRGKIDYRRVSDPLEIQILSEFSE